MRRLARRLFTLCSAASLVLCVAAAALWARSYLEWDEAEVARVGPAPGDATTWWAWSKNGTVSVGTLHWQKRRDGRPWAWSSFDVEWFNENCSGYRHWPAPSSTAGFKDRSFMFNRPDDVGPRYDRDAPDWAERWLAQRPHGSTRTRGWELWVPHWFLTVIFVLAPIARFAAFARSRRGRLAGLCSDCGYDLRGSPGRCPECGAAAQGA